VAVEAVVVLLVTVVPGLLVAVEAVHLLEAFIPLNHSQPLWL